MQGTAIKIISIVLIILLIGTAIGVIAYFTNGFTGEFKTFYVTVNGKDVLSSATGYMMSESEPLTVDVKYTFAEENTSYTVKVVPNPLPGKDFDFSINDELYSFQAEKDLTAGFNIEYGEQSFVITPKGNLSEVMAAVYPGSTLSDFSELGYENMFLLVVDSYNGESTVKIAFSLYEDVSGIEITPDHIYF